MKTLLVLITIALPLAIPVVGQTATQGDFKVTNPITNPRAFRSPMVVETVFAPALNRSLWTKENGKVPTAWKKGDWFSVAEYHGLGKFSCDDLTLTRGYSRRHNSWDTALMMRVTEHGAQSEIGIQVTVSSFKHVHDKLATVTFEVLDGATQLAMTSITVKVKEGDENDKEGKLVLPTSVLTAVPAPTLRITMTTRDY